jgi:enoyl-CoA hydratase
MELKVDPEKPCKEYPRFNLLKFDMVPPVARVTLDNPERLNVFSVPTLIEIEMAFEEIIENEAIKCVIFSSSSKKAFSAGADILEMSRRDVLGGIRFSDRGHRLARMIELQMPPVIIALRGMVLGGALEFACACDIRVATPNTTFSQPEINIGIIPGWGGTQRLMKLIGVGKAKEMIYTGSRINAQMALNLGLLNAVVEDEKLEDTVNELAKVISSKSRPVLMAAKQSIHVGLDSSLDIGLRFEIQKWGTLFDTHDRREGMKAFLEKRTPNFEDR